MIEIVPDFSTPLTTTDGQEFLLDHRFDFIRIYPGINWAIANIVTENGINRLHMSREIGLMVAKKSLIVCQDMDYIGESEYNKYIEAQANNLDDSWLTGDGEHPLG